MTGASFSGGSSRTTRGGSGMSSTELAMGTSRSTIHHDATIWCAVLALLHHAVSPRTRRLIIVLSDMWTGVLLRKSLLWILMLCLTNL